MIPSLRRSLQVRLVIGLLIIGMVPVAVSAVLIDQIANVAQRFASHEADKLRPPLVNAQAAYRELVVAKKDLYRETVRRLAADPATATATEIEAIPGVISAEIRDSSGTVLRRLTVGGAVSDDRGPRLMVEEPLADDSGRALALHFVANAQLTHDYEELGRVLDTADKMGKLRSALPSSYRTSFLAIVGGFAVVLTAIGLFLGRRVTRRIELLVDATRGVAAGDLSVRVDDPGNDDLTELAAAFNRMVRDLEAERRKSMYLQRIGTWQDVARRLAHEIKNPLTPIQLAMQQVHSSYAGDDAKFKNLVDTADEIVREEIDNLRRLVDAFSDLGRLPRVEPKAIDFAVIVADLEKDPLFRDQLEVTAPTEALSVRGDRLLLRRVMANLVENGMQAGADGDKPGRVAVTWQKDNDELVLVTVDDGGPGVLPDERESIFEPYITSKATGTGLGLAISKKIAIEHGGSLEVADEPSALGGARFLLRIPPADGEDTVDGA